MQTLCRVCHSPKLSKKFSAKILNKHLVDYFLCEDCGCLQTETPYWLDEAYKSPINIADTGLLARNIQFSKLTAVLIYSLFNPKDRFLDFAGGYGIFTRLMRDIGFNFYWQDPYSMNLLATGFEMKNDNAKFGLVTAFEAFEHFVQPINELEKLLSFSDNIFFSTALLPNPIPAPNEWWYYAPNAGQHISFYSMRTLGYLAEKYGMQLYSDSGSLHLFTKNQNISQRKFDYLLKFCGYGLFSLVKRKMKSLTTADMQTQISNENNN